MTKLTQSNLGEWKQRVHLAPERAARVEAAGSLLAEVIACPHRWATVAFFDILYGYSDPALQSLAASSLHFGLQRVLFDKDGMPSAGWLLSVMHHCIKSEKFDLLRELVLRGPPPNYPDTDIAHGATTEAGRWLDMLSSRADDASSFPPTLQGTWRSGAVVALAFAAELLADVDPTHAGTADLAGTKWGAVFFEIVMKRAIAEAAVAAPDDKTCAAPRRRLGL